jgi:hypothetical protein
VHGDGVAALLVHDSMGQIAHEPARPRPLPQLLLAAALTKDSNPTDWGPIKTRNSGPHSPELHRAAQLAELPALDSPAPDQRRLPPTFLAAWPGLPMAVRQASRS